MRERHGKICVIKAARVSIILRFLNLPMKDPGGYFLEAEDASFAGFISSTTLCFFYIMKCLQMLIFNAILPQLIHFVI